MARDLRPSDRVNLSETNILLVDDNPQSLDILSSIVQGFGVREQTRAASAAAAKDIVQKRQIDLILIESAMSEMDGADFVRWLRRETPEPLCMTPVVMLSGHATRAQVAKSRDCGASFIIAKPLTPAVLLQRLLWLAADQRAFVQSANYVGPDRRVRNEGPPAGQAGRRHDDLSGEVGAAVEPNMDQTEIDSFFKPQKVTL